MAYKLKHQKSGALGQDHFEEIELRDFSDATRSFTAIASVESADRLGDVIMCAGWELDNFTKNPILLAFHDATRPIGKSLERPWIETGNDGIKRLMFRPAFAENADGNSLYSLVKARYLKGFSVGFLPKETKPIKTKEEDRPLGWHQPTRYLRQELLEVSLCTIPAHQDALLQMQSMMKKGELFMPQRYLTLDPDLIVLDDEELIKLDEDVDLGVPDKEFKQMVKVAIDSALGRLQDDPENGRRPL